MWDQMLAALKKVEAKTGKKFGDPANPLLVSCRSGAKFSMPGMMDTVLNIGLTDKTAEGMVKLTGNPRFVYDSYRRLVEMFGSVVLGIPDEAFEEPLKEYKEKKGYKLDTDMTAEDWKAITETFKAVVKQRERLRFPAGPVRTARAGDRGRLQILERQARRRLPPRRPASPTTWARPSTSSRWSSATWATTRAPAWPSPATRSTGEKKMYGDYLLNAQGEDVVAGIRNTEKIENLAKDHARGLSAVHATSATSWKSIIKEMQDVEFTIERGKLWMLQTRNGKRTAKAAVKIAVDMANEGLITKEEAVLRVTPEQVDTLLHPQFDEKAKDKPPRKKVGSTPKA